MTTKKEVWVMDPSGLFHFRSEHQEESLGLTESAKVAIETRIVGSAAWFWFNETPAPIVHGDSVEELVRRWNKFRRAYQSGKKDEFLNILSNWTK